MRAVVPTARAVVSIRTDSTVCKFTLRSVRKLDGALDFEQGAAPFAARIGVVRDAVGAHAHPRTRFALDKPILRHGQIDVVRRFHLFCERFACMALVSFSDNVFVGVAPVARIQSTLAHCLGGQLAQNCGVAGFKLVVPHEVTEDAGGDAVFSCIEPCCAFLCTREFFHDLRLGSLDKSCIEAINVLLHGLFNRFEPFFDCERFIIVFDDVPFDERSKVGYFEILGRHQTKMESGVLVETVVTPAEVSVETFEDLDREISKLDTLLSAEAPVPIAPANVSSTLNEFLNEFFGFLQLTAQRRLSDTDDDPLEKEKPVVLKLAGDLERLAMTQTAIVEDPSVPEFEDCLSGMDETSRAVFLSMLKFKSDQVRLEADLERALCAERIRAIDTVVTTFLTVLAQWDIAKGAIESRSAQWTDYVKGSHRESFKKAEDLRSKYYAAVAAWIRNEPMLPTGLKSGFLDRPSYMGVRALLDAYTSVSVEPTMELPSVGLPRTVDRAALDRARIEAVLSMTEASPSAKLEMIQSTIAAEDPTAPEPSVTTAIPRSTTSAQLRKYLDALERYDTLVRSAEQRDLDVVRDEIDVTRATVKRDLLALFENTYRHVWGTLKTFETYHKTRVLSETKMIDDAFARSQQKLDTTLMSALSTNGMRYSQVQSCMDAAETAARQHQRVLRLQFDTKVIEVMRTIMNRLKRMYSCLSIDAKAACYVEAAVEAASLEETVVSVPAPPRSPSDDDNIAVEIVDIDVEGE